MWSLAGSVFMGFFSFVGALVFVRIQFLESLFLDYYISYFYLRPGRLLEKKERKCLKKHVFSKARRTVRKPGRFYEGGTCLTKSLRLFKGPDMFIKQESV